MSAAVEFVADVFEDTVEFVGDVVEDVGEAVVNVVETVVENPEIIVIAVAAPYAVASVGAAAGASAATIAAITPPITAAAITASQGGDLEDIGKAALTAYVAPQVGKAVGGATAQAVAGSGMSNAMQQTVVNTISSGAAGATAAAIQGGDIGATAALGAAGGAAGTLAGIGAAELGAPESTIPYAETAARVAAQGGDVGMALAQQGISDITRSMKDRPTDQPMTREELADATYELLQEELAALEGREPREGVQVAEADMSDRPPLRIDIEGVGDMTSEPREGGPDEVPETTLPAVDVIADMDVGALTDAQLIDLVRAGQRRRQEATRPAEGAVAPAEGEQVMPEVVVEADAIDDEISDEEILELVRLGMDRAEAPDEELPEGEMELGGGEGEGIPEGEMELGGGEGEGEAPVTPRVSGTPIVADRISRRGAASLTPRQVGQGYSAIVGDKEPTFGGDPGQQQEVWNQRSLRLRKALGL
jgi:hypothetical protein